MNNTYENINLDDLELLEIPRKRGIYFLYKGKELVYIGQTVNLYARLNNHLFDKNKEFDAYKFLEINGNINLNNIETFLIRRFQPIYNGNKKVNWSREYLNKRRRKNYHKNKKKIRVTTNISIL